MKQASPLQFFKPLKWLDGQPLLNVIEPYRQKTFMDALYSFDAIGRLATTWSVRRRTGRLRIWS